LSGAKINLNLAPNPSHLESVVPVVQGITRAKIENELDNKPNKILPIIVHGDAAIAGQGVVYEVIQMSQRDGYQTGGTIHIVINNQVGFTTNYLDGRKKKEKKKWRISIKQIFRRKRGHGFRCVILILLAMMLMASDHFSNRFHQFRTKAEVIVYPVQWVVGAPSQYNKRMGAPTTH
jgi:hypothetical protein